MFVVATSGCCPFRPCWRGRWFIFVRITVCVTICRRIIWVCKKGEKYIKIQLFLSKGRIFSEKYWYHFHCPKNVLCCILSFVFWIFPPLDTAVQLESADSKQNAISKSLFQDSFRHIFWAMRKMHHTFWKKATFSSAFPNVFAGSDEIERPCYRWYRL